MPQDIGRFSEQDSKSSGNNSKNLQLGSHQIKRLLHSKSTEQRDRLQKGRKSFLSVIYPSEE
jgi:hypothetical protein